MTRSTGTLVIVVAIVCASIAPASSAGRRHERRPAETAPSPSAPAPRPFMFYPQEIEGGVSGNLPFNNQIRKHTDPLNANGGR